MASRLPLISLVAVAMGALIASLAVPVQAAQSPTAAAVVGVDQAQASAPAQIAAQKTPATRAAEAIALNNRMTRLLDWTLFAIVLTLPTLAGLLIAAPFWFGPSKELGNGLGASVILLVVLLVFSREWVAFARLRETCAEAGVYCRIYPSDFIRYAIIGTLGFVDIAALYMASLRVDEWRRRHVRTHDS